MSNRPELSSHAHSAASPLSGVQELNPPVVACTILCARSTVSRADYEGSGGTSCLSSTQPEPLFEADPHGSALQHFNSIQRVPDVTVSPVEYLSILVVVQFWGTPHVCCPGALREVLFPRVVRHKGCESSCMATNTLVCPLLRMLLHQCVHMFGVGLGFSEPA